MKKTGTYKKDSEKIKVCRLATVPFYVTNHLKSQVEYLRDSNLDVTLISSYGPEIKKIDFGPGLTYKPVEISRLLDPVKDFFTLIKLIRIFHKNKFDIVHSTTPKAGLLAAIAGFVVNVPLRFHTWTGQPWVTLEGVKRWVIKLSDKLIGCLCTRCYADSPSQRQFLIDEKVISGNKIRVINKGSLSGVNLDKFNPERFTPEQRESLKDQIGVPPNSIIITLIGRINRDKGVLELISAFRSILEDGYETELLLIGPLDQDSEGDDFLELENIIADNSKIHYLGYQDEPEQYLAISDIFCLPSYREGFGTTVIEAAAMGVPTVGTRINGLVDAIVENETGMLVPLKDVSALKQALKELMDDPELLKKMGAKARKRSLTHFDKRMIDKMVYEEYLKILQQTR